MRILVWNDMEGPSGIDDRKMLEDMSLYEQAKIYATEDVNAAIRGIKKANSEAVIDIFDGHGVGGNLILDKLAPHNNFVGGGWITTFYQMVQTGGVKDYDAVLLLGQHAAEGTEDGFLSHTNTGLTALKVNGKYAGEAPQLAWVFGHFDIPALLVVGDEACTREAKALLPGIETIAVKKGITKEKAECIPVEEAHKLIEEAAFKVVKNILSSKPFKVDLPVTIGVYYFSEDMAETHSKFPRTTRSGKYSVTYQADDFLEGWLAYNICRVLTRQFFLNEAIKRVSQMEEFGKIQKEFVEEFRKKFKEEYPFEKVKY